MRNMAFLDNSLIREGLRILRQRLPPGWNVSERTVSSSPGPIDAEVEIAGPDRRAGLIALEARARLDPKGVRLLVDATRAARSSGALVVVSPYLSEGTRTRLGGADIG